jgi:MFS superfamily sulfate permease-like transporter
MNGVSMVGDMTRDHDRANLAHAIVGCIALFVLWPLNVIFAGFFKSIKIHIVFSMILMVFLVVSYALGGVTSAEYNRVSPIPITVSHWITPPEADADRYNSLSPSIPPTKY